MRGSAAAAGSVYWQTALLCSKVESWTRMDSMDEGSLCPHQCSRRIKPGSNAETIDIKRSQGLLNQSAQDWEPLSTVLHKWGGAHQTSKHPPKPNL